MTTGNEKFNEFAALRKKISAKLLSFDEWIKLHPELKGKKEDCYECEGTGGFLCDHCGTQIDCDYCNGRGYDEIDKIEYQQSKARDIKLIMANPAIMESLLKS